MGFYLCFMNVPSLNSLNANASSSFVFITIGPPNATGSFRGNPSNHSILESSKALSSTIEPSCKITGRRMDEEKEYLVQRPGSVQGEGNL